MSRYTVKGENGSVLFFVAAGVLPVLFFLGALSLDITSYYLKKQHVQKILDDATLYSYKFLPYTEAASQAARQYVDQFGENISQVTEIVVTPDSVTATYRGNAPLIFTNYFVEESDIALRAVSRTVGSAYDALLLLDASDYMAPELPLGVPWGDPIQEPASSFFDIEHPVSFMTQQGTLENIDPRLLTQQCYNPAFSEIKRALIRTYQHLASFQRNAIGVAVFPGSPAFLDDIRTVSGGIQSGEFGDTQFAAHQGTYVIGDYCAAVFSRDLNPKFQLPTSTGLTGLWQAPQGAPPIVSIPTFQFEPQYEPYLTVSESVWAQAARKDDTVDAVKLFQGVKTRLLASELIEARGGLIDKVNKTAIVFAGDVPRQGAVRFPDGALVSQLTAELQDFLNLTQQYEFDITINYVVMSHPGVTVEPSRFSALQSFFDSVSSGYTGQGGKLNLKAFYASNATQVIDEIVPYLGIGNKASLLAR